MATNEETPPTFMLEPSSKGDTVPGARHAERPAGNDAGYVLGPTLGRGGMGEVLLAEDRRIGREVAIKRMRAEAPSEVAVARFIREARIQARLDHPAIVPVHEIGRDGHGLPYFTMKRLRGVTLASVIERGEASLPTLLRPFADVCLAIEYVHTRGVIHRDLKPANIMLGDYGEVYVIDWGVARIVGEPDQGSSPSHDASPLSTRAGAVLGTPGYMAPEQARGETATFAVDAYALGAILFEILTREPLASGNKSPLGVSPLRRAPDRGIPPELDRICVAALTESPAARPTPRAIADAVRRYLDGDRDLALRRTLATAELAAAQAALAAGDGDQRATAIAAAGRALALDPSSTAAAELVSCLLLEPPREVPAALAAQLDAEDDVDIRRQASGAAWAMLAYVAIIPLVLWTGVRSWSLFAVTFALIIALAVRAIWTARGAARSMVPSVVGTAVLAALLTRFFGPFVVVPAFVSLLAATVGGVAPVVRRPVLVLGAMLAAFAVPLVLEATEVWSTTWHITNGALVTVPTAIAFGGTATVVLLIVSNGMLIAVIHGFTRTLWRDQQAARRSLRMQAWHLEQLLPATARRGTSG